MFAYKFELGVVAIVVACGCGHFGELRIGRREESERERKLKTKISLNLDKPSVFCLLYIWLFFISFRFDPKHYTATCCQFSSISI